MVRRREGKGKMGGGREMGREKRWEKRDGGKGCRVKSRVSGVGRDGGKREGVREGNMKRKLEKK